MTRQLHTALRAAQEGMTPTTGLDLPAALLYLALTTAPLEDAPDHLGTLTVAGPGPVPLAVRAGTVLGDPRGPDLSTDEVWVQAISPAHPPDVHRVTVQELRAAKREGRAARDAQGREVFRSPCAVLDHAGTVTPVPGLTPLTALARLDSLTGPHEFPSHVVSVRLSTQADLKDTLHALLGPAEPA